MLQPDEMKTKTIVEYSSGNTIVSMSIVARVLHGIEGVHAYFTNKTSDARVKLLRFFGLKVYVDKLKLSCVWFT